MSISASEILLLHSRADRALRALVADRLSEFDVTMMEWLLLGVISQGPKEGVSMSAVANQLDVTLPQVTALMNSLAKKRLVRLKTQRQDRRSRHALLTAKGADIWRQVDKVAQTAMDTWLQSMPEDQQKGYVEAIKTMAYQQGVAV